MFIIHILPPSRSFYKKRQIIKTNCSFALLNIINANTNFNIVFKIKNNIPTYFKIMYYYKMKIEGEYSSSIFIFKKYINLKCIDVLFFIKKTILKFVFAFIIFNNAKLQLVLII